MKHGFIHLLVSLVIAVLVAGCGSVRHESAMEWMQKQPNYLDP